MEEGKHALLPALSASCPGRFLQLVQVDFLQAELVKRDFTVSCMHADLDQKERDLVMRHSVKVKLECWKHFLPGWIRMVMYGPYHIHIHSISAIPIHHYSWCFRIFMLPCGETYLPRWVSFGVFPCPHFHRFAGSWDRCTTGLTRCCLTAKWTELWAKH